MLSVSSSANAANLPPLKPCHDARSARAHPNMGDLGPSSSSLIILRAVRTGGDSLKSESAMVMSNASDAWDLGGCAALVAPIGSSSESNRVGLQPTRLVTFLTEHPEKNLRVPMWGVCPFSSGARPCQIKIPWCQVVLQSLQLPDWRRDCGGLRHSEPPSHVLPRFCEPPTLRCMALSD